MNVGMRRAVCPHCNAAVRMRPKMYMLYSVVPLILMIGLLASTISSRLFVVFVIGLLGIRVLWFFVAPLVVPLEPVGRPL